MGSDQQKNDGLFTFISTGLNFLIEGYLMVGFRFSQKLIKADNYFVKRNSRTKRLIFLIAAVTFSALMVFFIYTFSAQYIYLNLGYFLVYPMIHFFFCLLIAEELFVNELSFKINKHLLKTEISSLDTLEGLLEDQGRMPIGISYLDNKPLFIESKNRTRHMMISGATGQGKSSFAISLRRHDLKWNRPIIDIDPKGSSEDIDIIKEYCSLYGREKDFIHFNIVDFTTSYSYNPLSFGSVDERIEKITTVLGLDNEFYRGFASNIFSIIFQCFETLNQTPTMRDLCDLLLDKNHLQLFFRKVLELDSDENLELKKQIRAFKDFDKEKILGIQAKISRLNSPSFSKVLNPSPNKQRNLDLVDIVKTNKYAYFQLNIAQYKEVSTYLINFILYDLKLICGLIDSKKLELNSDFLPVYIDEYASFGNEDFPEFLRVARSGKVGITVMFQSYASLDLITAVLKDEITTNTVYSIHFNPGGSVADIDFIAKMPGTLYLNQRSFQVLGNGRNPGDESKGTQFRTEEMRADANIYRELKMGQAVVYLKDSNQINLIETWHGKKALATFKELKKKGGTDSQTLMDDKKESSHAIPSLSPKISANLEEFI